MKQLFLFTFFLLSAGTLQAQGILKKVALENTNQLTPVRVSLKPETYLGKLSVRVADTARGISSEAKFAKIKDLPFQNGTIELEVAGKPLSQAGESARGFVGLAFRINEDNSKFECIYLRPTNGRASDQIRRNHSVQYISYPDYPWEKTRKETPGKYETYVDLAPGEWTKIKIEVQGNKARLYVHGAPQPTLIVNDLQLGANQSGSLGLWVGSGTEAHFRNLVVTHRP